MDKIKRIEMRVTESEFNKIKKMSHELNMNKSQFILNAIKFVELHRKEFKKYEE